MLVGLPIPFIFLLSFTFRLLTMECKHISGEAPEVVTATFSTGINEDVPGTHFWIHEIGRALPALNPKYQQCSKHVTCINPLILLTALCRKDQIYVHFMREEKTPKGLGVFPRDRQLRSQNSEPKAAALESRLEPDIVMLCILIIPHKWKLLLLCHSYPFSLPW